MEVYTLCIYILCGVYNEADTWCQDLVLLQYLLTWADWMEVKSTAKERSHSAVVPSSVTEKATPDTDSDWDLNK